MGEGINIDINIETNNVTVLQRSPNTLGTENCTTLVNYIIFQLKIPLSFITNKINSHLFESKMIINL